MDIQKYKASWLFFIITGFSLIGGSQLLSGYQQTAEIINKEHEHEHTHTAHVAVQDTIEKIIKSEEEWRQILTAEEFYVLRENGTEAPFQNEFYDHKQKGVYVCAACGNPVYSSETKFKSGTGWPSFYAPIAKNAVDTETDTSFGMLRTEVHCNRCGGHLGHIFKDGPQPTGLRHCINSVALDFKPKASE